MQPFFDLLRGSIGTSKEFKPRLSPEEWRAMYGLCRKQGVTAIVFDCIKSLPLAVSPDKALIMQWMASAIGVERTMLRMQSTAEEFAREMARHNVSVVVLKGLAFAQYYPNPLYRECGDLDCYMMGMKEEGDKLINELGGTMEEAGYKHSHLLYKGLTIENHGCFTSFDNTPRGILTERWLSELLMEGQRALNGTELLSPSASFNAFFLLRHAQGHFIKEGIRMRHVLDWAMLLRSEEKHVDWPKFLQILEDTHTARFASVVTAIVIQLLCVEIVDESLRNLADSSDKKIVVAVVDDIMGEQPDIYVNGLWHKVKRIFRRFRRMWLFRSLASESYPRMVWNAFAFSSYVNRKLDY